MKGKTFALDYTQGCHRSGLKNKDNQTTIQTCLCNK